MARIISSSSGLRLAWICMSIPMLVGCEHLNYYQQALSGQWQLWSAQRSLADVLEDPAVETRLRGRLADVQNMRRFAGAELGLPVGHQYGHYSDLGRRYAVWNVFAAAEFSLEPESWCYPVAGCVHYRGYFQQGAALRKAAALRGQGLDVFVGGVAAYSTLGWFDDPLLNTYIYWRESALAALLFHELAHRRLYVPGDTRFNESFAEAVAVEGTRAWFKAAGNNAELQRFEVELARREEFQLQVKSLRDALGQLYASQLAPDVMRQQKAEIIRAWRASYLHWRTLHPEASYFDGFVFGELNNARLAASSDYSHWQGAFRQLWREKGGDWPEFYRAAALLGALGERERFLALEALSMRASR